MVVLLGNQWIPVTHLTGTLGKCAKLWEATSYPVGAGWATGAAEWWVGFPCVCFYAPQHMLQFEMSLSSLARISLGSLQGFCLISSGFLRAYVEILKGVARSPGSFDIHFML